MRKKRICCFCETWQSGGIESFLYNVLTHMDLSGLEVDVVAARLEDSVFTRRLEEAGVHFRQLSGSPRRLWTNWRMFRALLEKRDYDVVHLNIYHGLSLKYAQLASRAGVPVRIAHSHNTDLRKSAARPLKLWLHRRAKARCTRFATQLWACSSGAARFLFAEAALAEKGFQFIPNGIDTGRFRFDPAAREQVRAELGMERSFVVGNVGRLCAQKNQDFLLDVFAELVKQAPESRLLLVGEGEQRPALEQKARRLGISGAVIFYGLSQNVERLLWGMDVLVMPSRFEGLPVTAVEAQAAGLPCVLSSEITAECAVTGDVAFLPLSAEAGAWARQLLCVKTSPPDRLAAAEKVRAAGFDTASVARQIQREFVGDSIHGQA